MIGKITRGQRVGGLVRYLFGPGDANEHTDPRVVAAGTSRRRWSRRRRRAAGATSGRSSTSSACPWPGSTAGSSACGTARFGPPRATGHSATQSGGTSRRRSWTRRGWRRGATTADAVGSPCATTRTTCIWWPPWPARTAAGPGTSTTGGRSSRGAGGSKPTTDSRWWPCPIGRSRPRRGAARPRRRPGPRRNADTGLAGEPARDRLRREVQLAAAGASGTDEFFDRLRSAGVMVEARMRTQHPGERTGYKVSWPRYCNRDGRPVWFGGGKLAPDLSLPRLEKHWRTVVDAAGNGWGNASTPGADRPHRPGPATACRCGSGSVTTSSGPRRRRPGPTTSSTGCEELGSWSGSGTAISGLMS